MLKTAAASIFTLTLAVAVPSAHAQFGSGIVFDPTQSAHAYTQILQEGKSLGNEATQIEQGTRLYTNAVQMATTALNTYGTVMRQYNLYHQMVQSPRMLYSRFLPAQRLVFDATNRKYVWQLDGLGQFLEHGDRGRSRLAAGERSNHNLHDRGIQQLDHRRTTANRRPGSDHRHRRLGHEHQSPSPRNHSSQSASETSGYRKP